MSDGPGDDVIPTDSFTAFEDEIIDRLYVLNAERAREEAQRITQRYEALGDVSKIECSQGVRNSVKYWDNQSR